MTPKIVGKFKDGTPLTPEVAEIIARGFGFTSAREMDQIFAHNDARRAMRRTERAA